MGKVIEALFDGTVFRPAEPLTLEPNTRVWIVIETALPVVTNTSPSFLRTARSLNLEGPSDWSTNLENYLYGDRTQDEG